MLITASLMLGVYTILEVEQVGWGRPADARPQRRLAGARLARSSPARRGSRNPLMPLRLFRSRNVSGANVVAGAAGRRACSAMFFLGALYMQQILGYDALEVGLAFLPATIVMGTLSLGFAERLIMRFGAAADADRRAWR